MVEPAILAQMVDRLVAGFAPERIILFGSQARGEADGCSDIDLLIITRLQRSRRELLLAMERSLRGLPVARDLVVLTPEEYARDCDIPGTIARPASREGRVLYERHTN